MHMDDAPAAIITGASEPVFPESVNAHPFLPDSLRSHLGLVDNARRYARDAYQLTALLHSRERVHVLAARRSAAGDPLRPSRLLLAVPGPALAGRVAAFYGVAAAAATGVATAAVLREDTPQPQLRPAPSGFLLPPDPVIQLDRPLERLSVTAFRSIIQSPYLFALQRNLGGDAVDDSAGELDPLGFGGLAHYVLEEFGRSDAADSTELAVVAATLDALLDGQARRRFGRTALPAVRLQVEQLRARLHAFAGWQAARAAGGWRIAAVECRTPDEGVPFDVDGEPIRLTGRIDRIDHNPATGEWAVFDYKTGDRAATPDQAHRAGRGEDRDWVDLQLPLYRHILPHVLDASGSRVFAGDTGQVTMAYVTLCAELDAIRHEPAEWTGAELAAADEKARACVRVLRGGSFSWNAVHGFTADDLTALLGIGRLTAWEDGDE
jgi:ATP-dependent helicase/nuclease subunit B